MATTAKATALIQDRALIEKALTTPRMAIRQDPPAVPAQEAEATHAGTAAEAIVEAVPEVAPEGNTLAPDTLPMKSASVLVLQCLLVVVMLAIETTLRLAVVLASLASQSTRRSVILRRFSPSMVPLRMFKLYTTHKLAVPEDFRLCTLKTRKTLLRLKSAATESTLVDGRFASTFL